MSTEGWLWEFGFVLNNREWATLAWLGVLAIVFLISRRIWMSFVGLVKASLAPKLLRVWIAYAVWIAALIALMDALGLWRPVLSKDTIVWASTAGLGLVVTFTDASKSGFFRSAVRKAVGASVLLQYLVTLATFSLWVELLLQPVVAVFAVAPMIRSNSTQDHPQSRAGVWFFLLLLAAMVANTARELLVSWESVDLTLFLFRAIWPIVLAFWVLVAVFWLAVISSYELAFGRIDLYLEKDGKPAWKPKFALAMALRLRLGLVHEAAKGHTFHVAHADSFRSAAKAAFAFRTERIDEVRREEDYQTNLRWHAGSRRVAEDGRPLDKREFRETTRALEWLHTCQVGWYRCQPTGYKPDLIDRFQDDFSHQGLPTPAGIVLRVSDDGQRWYAWRRTPSGHCFAIGASQHPPSQWLYDRGEPPQDFPGLGPEWGDRPLVDDCAPNWYE